MLTPQNATELEKGSDTQKQDDFVQKAYTVLSRKDGIAKKLTQTQVGLLINTHLMHAC